MEEENPPDMPKGTALRKCNLPRAICRHTVGHEHTMFHRMICGLGVMGAGVTVALVPAIADLHALFSHAAFELVGFAIHALGAVPYLEWLLEENVA